MIDVSSVNHHPVIEEITDALCIRIQNPDRKFFRLVATYFLAKMAATMRAEVDTKFRKVIPVNVYAVALATSGFGKGYSVNILEREFLNDFRKRFIEETFPVIAEDNLYEMACDRALKSGKDVDKEKETLQREFELAGEILFTFDNANPAAIKQLRQKLLLGNTGAINLQIDEIGSNLMGSTDVLNVFLELYDQGLIKNSLRMNTSERTRGIELDGKTPANALLFGTYSKLLDGGQVEEHFTSFLDTGYGRRCIFAWGEGQAGEDTRTDDEVYDELVAAQNSAAYAHLANHFMTLADPAKAHWKMEMAPSVGKIAIRYMRDCEDRTKRMDQFSEIRINEMKHRYYKAIKIAGALAFVDESVDVTSDHMMQAIKLVEESGDAFDKLMTREKNYMRLARFIASKGERMTQSEIHEKLPFFKLNNQVRQELMGRAVEWGYWNHIIIRKTFQDGIEFYEGETLKESDPSNLILSYSDHNAYNYRTEPAPFDQLHRLTQAPGLHWCNHTFENGHRTKATAKPGFNMVVLDCDGDVTMETVHELLGDYKFMTYTTKRHTDQENRFRVILPTNYVLPLDEEDYEVFMDNVMAWAPFPSDAGARERNRKWLSHDGGSYFYNPNPEAQLFDVLPFIPKTRRNEVYQEQMQELQNLDNLERWFAQRMATGNRNNQMIKFALALVDAGMTYSEVERKVLEFNGRVSNGLEVDELRNTVLVTVAKKLQEKAAA